MAATVAHAVAPALSPPITTAFIPAIRVNRRFSNGTITSGVGPDCKNFSAFQTCSSDGEYGSCMGTGATSSCNCNHGLDYLNCVSTAVATSSCSAALGLGDWEDYKRDWLQVSCNKPPQSVMISISQPSYVDISYTPVVTVTPSIPITTQPNRIAKPSYSGTGQLLAGPCTQTQYTLIDAGEMVYQAALVGCDADRPECCPFEVATTSGNRVAGVGGGFPTPAVNALSALTACPDDYYPVSGQCCPNGYFKFTTQIAYQTPCFSSFKAELTPPPVTVGLPNNPTDMSKPTSAINNLVWAMGYNMTQTSSGLSQAATIGIGVGASVFGIAVIGLLAMVFIRIRRSKKAALEEQRIHSVASEQQHQQEPYHKGGYAPPMQQNLSPPASPPAHGHGFGSGPQIPQQQGWQHQPQVSEVQQQQQYHAGSWNQGYGDNGQYKTHGYGYQQPGGYDQGYRR
ncbi:hypothetical protein V8F33_010344 [Rhypophila sp. PSN 637]